VDGEFFSFSCDYVFNLFNKFGKSFENFIDISSLLHTDDSKLIFFIDPDKTL
jgi:hypothetical protein